jgi:protein arginine kinase activator
LDGKKCDKCGRKATHHAVEIEKGKKIEKHLCDAHAAEEGLAFKTGHMPINELLTSFVKLHSGTTQREDLVCKSCGLTYSEFQERTLLGCPGCYSSFEPMLGPLLERAHEGGDHHVGKVPRRAGTGEGRQEHLLRLRKRLQEAVTAEDYELAAHLRDEVSRMEKGRA